MYRYRYRQLIFTGYLVCANMFTYIKSFKPYEEDTVIIIFFS